MTGESEGLKNILEVKEFVRNTIEDAKVKLDSALVNNPKFEEVLYKEINYLFYKTGDVKFTVTIADDKKSITLNSYSPIVDCSNPAFNGKNKAFIRTVIYLDNKDLVCEYNQGVLFDRNLLEQNNLRTGLQYESKLETYYALKFYDENGIEYSDNSYSDIYHFDNPSSEIDLRERTMSSFHKPVFNRYTLASIPIHVMKASVRNTYRKNGSLAIIHSNTGTATTKGYKDVNSTLFTCHPLFPEALRGQVMIAKTVEDENKELKFEIVNNYCESFEKAFEKARNEFKAGMEDSHLKEYNKRAYDFILANI